MIFTNKKNLIYVRRNALEFFHGDEKLELTIPVTILQNLEIVDSERFDKLLFDFLLKIKKQKALMVLSSDVLFEKETVAKDEKDLDGKYQNFKDSLPVSSDKVAIKKIISGESIFFIAVNKKIYQEISAVLEKAGWEIKAVVPVTLFKEKLGMEDNELAVSSANKILSDKDLIRISDFLSETQGEVIKKSPNYKIFIFFILGFILIFIITISLGIRFNFLSIPGLGNRGNSEKLVKEAVESTPSAFEESSKAANIEEYLSIQVLNGSGVAGQAAKVSSSLIEIGYKNIEVGNADVVGTKTFAYFSKYVKEKDKEEIKNMLDENFTDVEIQEHSEDSEFDVLITTGEEINK